ncbi:MAG: secretin N-terminal domain-containing protein [Sphingobacteriia bacterium]|nr:secretin N-terminal domain-containing protein [Sphingobacteriia bacterium]
MLNLVKPFILLIVILLTTTCAHPERMREKFDRITGKYNDPELKLSQEEYKEKLFKNSKKALSEDKLDSSFEPQPFIAPPIPPSFKKDKLVTLSISNDVDVKDVLLELARLAEIDVEIDPKVSGGIILKVSDRPLTEVIDRVTELAYLRYTITNNVLHVEPDTPYMVSYPVDFLNLVRNNKSNYKVSVSLDGSSGSSGSSSIGSGSNTEITSEQKEDLWDTISKDIKQMIESVNYTATGSAPYVTINKQAGIINVVTNSRAHTNIKSYLAKVRTSISAQALIEAKIVEVSLNEEYKTGINWNVLDRNGLLGAQNDFTNVLGEYTANPGGITIGVLNGLKNTLGKKFDPTTNASSLIAAVNLMDLFGVTRTLSSPRVHAMNNQQAVLSFAQNYVYFKLNIETNNDSSATTTTSQTNVTSDLKTVPIGIILTLQPSINTDTNEITMSIRPTISRITEFKSDPSVTYVLATSSTDLSDSGLESNVPVVEVKELDSVLKIKSGDIMVIGGMMEDRFMSNESGIPLLKDMFIAGNLFKSNGKVKKTIQTVIFIQATIIPGGNSYSQSDKDFYNTFAHDPNPFSLK